jgi:hypothetical protein
VQEFDGDRVGHHLLYEVDVQMLSYGPGTTAAHGDFESGIGKVALSQQEELAYAFALFGLVSSVLRKY